MLVFSSVLCLSTEIKFKTHSKFIQKWTEWNIHWHFNVMGIRCLCNTVHLVQLPSDTEVQSLKIAFVINETWLLRNFSFCFWNFLWLFLFLFLLNILGENLAVSCMLERQFKKPSLATLVVGMILSSICIYISPHTGAEILIKQIILKIC